MVKGLTGVLKVHILAVQGILQAVRHDLQLHYLLPYCHVWFGDVNFYFRVVYLTCKAITHHLGKVPATHEHVFNMFNIDIFIPPYPNYL